MVYLTGEVKSTLLKDMRYLLSFVAWFSTSLVQVLLTSFLLLYLTDYVKIGVLNDDDEASMIYTRITGISFIISALIIPFIGKLIDVVPTKLVFPFVFLTRALFCFQLRYVKDPRSLYC